VIANWLVARFIAWTVKHDPDGQRVVTHDTHSLLFIRRCPFWDDEHHYLKRDGELVRAFRPPWYRPFNILLHEWKAAHREAMHDHPRWSITICLRGRIIEHTPWGSRPLRPGSVVFRSRKAIHAFELPADAGEPWTLFIVGRRNHRQNGFIVKPFGAKA
jgi:hypothetical protein